MNAIHLQWVHKKSASNQKKHGVSFEEAATVFYDEDALEFHDPDHSQSEDKFFLLGLSAQARVLVICHCVRESESVIRIISARKAAKQESKKYWEEKL